MLRVACIVGNIATGGVASVVMEYFRKLDKSRFQFDFFSYSPSPFDEEIKSNGGRVFFIEPFSRPIKATRYLARLLADGSYDIAHSHLNTLNCFALAAAKRAGIGVRIAHNHSTGTRSELKTIAKVILKPLVFRRATHLAACSRLSAEWAYGTKRNATVFNNAIDLHKFSFDEQKRRTIRAELGLEGKLVIGHAGRFVYQKNHEFLCRVMREVAGRLPNAMLLLAGSGKGEAKVRALVERLGIADRVVFLGEWRQMREFYWAIDAFVLPSRYEGLPVVAVEAQSAGLPVLMSDRVTAEAVIAGARRLPLDGDWTSAIVQMLGEPRGDNIAAMAEAGFDINSEAARLQDFYLTATNKH